MPKRAKFNLGSYRLVSGDMGYIIPIQCKDVIPGDIFKGASQAFIRMQPMLAPIMHPIHVRIHHFFVPYRLIWTGFEDFITKNDDQLIVPQIEFEENNKGSLADYFGLPLFKKDELKEEDGTTPRKLRMSALPFRAYNLIWNEYYRDQDLQDEIPIELEGGDIVDPVDTTTPVDLRMACWQKDYFTLSRPWEQKGEEVVIPVYTTGFKTRFLKYEIVSAPHNYYKGCVVGDGSGSHAQLGAESLTVVNFNEFRGYAKGDNVYHIDVKLKYADSLICTGIPATSVATDWIVNSVEEVDEGIDPVYDLQHTWDHNVPHQQDQVRITGKITFTIPGDASGHISISDIRAGIAEQRLRERKAKFGSEYKDLLASYGINYQDSRLQLPEYIAGGSSLLRVSEVIQTAPSETLGNVGDLKGYGLGLAKSNGFKRYFPEHGIFMSLMSIMPTAVYSQGMERFFLKTAPDDFYQREIAQLIPMQEIFNQELYFKAPMDSYFGYIDRYDEYRHSQNTVHGDFRDVYDYWHLARQFDKQPVLNGDFVRSSPSKRIFVEQTNHCMLMMIQNMCRARRILPKQSKTGAL